MKKLQDLPHLAHKFGLSYRMRPVLKAMGVDLRPIESTLDGQRSALLNSLGVELVVDGGAHVGSSGKRIRSWGYTGRIVSFEPNPDSFKRLTQVGAKDPDWAAVNVGLSTSRGTSELYLHAGADSPFNSLHEMSEFGQRATGITSSTLRVELDTLDHLLLNMAMRDQCTWLKLDIQGHEI